MKRLIAIGLAAVIGGAVGAASLTAASAVTVPIDADFGILLPGATAEGSTPVEIPSASVVTAAGWTERTGAGVWGARLCSATDCTPLEALAGTEITAGSYQVVIDVTMPADRLAAGETSASGSIAFMESVELPLTDGGLAVTGAAMPWIAMIAGATALGTGAAILLRRRRSTHEENGA